MIVHGNAKLGPAGRFALTQAIGGGTVGLMRPRRSSGQEGGRLIARALRTAARGCSMLMRRSGSARRECGRAGDRGLLPARPDTHTRPCGRCCVVAACPRSAPPEGHRSPL